MEMGKAFVRQATDYGWSYEKIGQLAGISDVRVGQIIELYRNATPVIQGLINDGTIKPTFAFTTLRAEGYDGPKAEAKLVKAVETAKEGGRTRAMPKDLRGPKLVVVQPAAEPVVAVEPSAPVASAEPVAAPVAPVAPVAAVETPKGAAKPVDTAQAVRVLRKATVTSENGVTTVQLSDADWAKVAKAFGI